MLAGFSPLLLDPPLPSFLTVGSRPRPFVPYRSARSPLPSSSSTSVPAHPHKKPKSSVGATGGFSLYLLLPSFHHSFFTSPLTFPSFRPSASLFFHRTALFGPSCEPSHRSIPLPRLFVPESVALSRFTVYLKVASRFHPHASDSQPSSNPDDCAAVFFVELENYSLLQ